MNHEEAMKKIFEKRPDIKESYDKLDPTYKKISEGYKRMGPKYSVAHQIIERRVELEMTALDVADQAGIDRSSYLEFERGDSLCTLKTLFKVMDVLGLYLSLEVKDTDED